MAHFCASCGSGITDGAAFCPNCGAPAQPGAGAQSSSLPPPPPGGAVAPPPPGPPTAVGFPAAGGDEPPGEKKKNVPLLVILGIGAVLLLVAGVLAFSGGGDKDQADDSPTTTAVTSAGEVFLEPATQPGPDPFTASVDTNTADAPARVMPARAGVTTTVPRTTTSGATTTVTPTTGVPTATTLPLDSAVGVRTIEATRPGLYGGTRDNASCNAAQMITYLQSEPEKAAAWAGVQGIDPARIPEYIAGLTPVVLRLDTRVTMYGFRNGVATARQVVLEAGSAVFVDEYGIPRAKCSCGNPLAPPIAQPEGITWRGDPWPGFDPTTIVVVNNTTNITINDFTLVDLNGAGFLKRRPGTTDGRVDDGPVLIDHICDLYPEACIPPDLIPPDVIVPTTRPGEPELGTGDVQVTLRWGSTADLDLAVIDPAGSRIDFTTPTSPSGGELDVDSNAACSSATTSPVENVFWPPGQSPEGEYTVIVSYWAECGDATGPQSYELSVLMNGVSIEPTAAGVSYRTDPGGATAVEAAFTVRAPAARTAGRGERLTQVAGTLGAPSEESSYTFAKEVGQEINPVPGTPENLNVDPLAPGSLEVSWTPGGVETNAPETGYEITVDPMGVRFVVPFDTLSFTIPGLEPGVAYTISVVAFNEAGGSPPATAIVETMGEEPSVPQTAPPPASPDGSAVETLEQYCDRLFPDDFMNWTLCMHDPAGDPIPA